MNRKEMFEIHNKLKNKERLTDDEVVKLSRFRRELNKNKKFVIVEKLDLMEGEDLSDFYWTLYESVETNRIILGDGSFDISLCGVYKDYVIVQDWNTGKHFKSNFTRNSDGEFEFSEPVEVKMVWTEVNDTEKSLNKNEYEYVDFNEISKSKNKNKWSFLPDNLR